MSSVHIDIFGLGESPYALHPVFLKFPNIAFETFFNVCLIDDGHFSYFQRGNSSAFSFYVPASSPFYGRDVVVYVFDINVQSLPTPFYSVLVSIYVFMALSTVFHFISYPDNCQLSRSVLPVLFLPYLSVQLYIFLCTSPSSLI